MAMRLSLRDPVSTLQRDLVALLGDTAARLDRQSVPLATRIHDARKNLKRARAFALLLPQPLAGEADRALRGIHQRLGARRDQDATLEAIDRVLPLARGSARKALQRIRDDMARTATDAGTAPVAAVRRALMRLARRIGAEPLDGDFGVLLEGIEAGARRSRRGLRRALASGEAHDFHRWRKWMKYYWFHLRYVTPLWPQLLRVEANAAEHAAEWLGQSQDLELVRAAIAAAPLDDDAESSIRAALLALVDREQQRLQRKAASLGLHLHAQSPRAFSRRLKGYWKARARPAGRHRAADA